MSFLGSITNFDPQTQEWMIFKGRLTQFLTLNNITDEERKRALLLTLLTDEAYRLLSNICHPKKVEATAYSELIILLDGHYTPSRSTFADKANFYDAVQAEGESVQNWAARLRGLAVYCDFGASLDTLFRDRFVLGLRPGPARDRLCEQNSSALTFSKALELAQQAVCAARARTVVPGVGAAAVKEEPLFRASMGRPGGGGARASGPARDQPANRCSVCGLRGHETEKCRYKNYRCEKCKVKGHLKKVCTEKVNNIVTEVQSQSGQRPETCSDCEECNLFNLRFPN
ncbi:uncharacterized protein LOC126366325 [Pectinophora gossypiella]|uniref:uncharacterized protein LOC126366325 n=1 Tax=Pectinophora gossypiella TaxID=13191 RepID=UPI00214E380B|nr:uncharacterized protein LOC126366325 [Pectinophora gossypiella]